MAILSINKSGVEERSYHVLLLSKLRLNFFLNKRFGSPGYTITKLESTALGKITSNPFALQAALYAWRVAFSTPHVGIFFVLGQHFALRSPQVTTFYNSSVIPAFVRQLLSLQFGKNNVIIP